MLGRLQTKILQCTIQWCEIEHFPPRRSGVEIGVQVLRVMQSVQCQLELEGAALS